MSIVSNILYPASLPDTSQQGGRNGGPGMGGAGNSYEHGNMLPNLYSAEMMSAPFAAYHQQQQFPPNYSCNNGKQFPVHTSRTSLVTIVFKHSPVWTNCMLFVRMFPGCCFPRFKKLTTCIINLVFLVNAFPHLRSSKRVCFHHVTAVCSEHRTA